MIWKFIGNLIAKKSINSQNIMTVNPIAVTYIYPHIGVSYFGGVDPATTSTDVLVNLVIETWVRKKFNSKYYLFKYTKILKYNYKKADQLPFVKGILNEVSKDVNNIMNFELDSDWRLDCDQKRS